jgi:hypothetical protein
MSLSVSHPAPLCTSWIAPGELIGWGWSFRCSRLLPPQPLPSGDAKSSSEREEVASGGARRLGSSGDTKGVFDLGQKSVSQAPQVQVLCLIS